MKPKKYRPFIRPGMNGAVQWDKPWSELPYSFWSRCNFSETEAFAKSVGLTLWYERSAKHPDKQFSFKGPRFEVDSAPTFVSKHGTVEGAVMRRLPSKDKKVFFDFVLSMMKSRNRGCIDEDLVMELFLELDDPDYIASVLKSKDFQEQCVKFKQQDKKLLALIAEEYRTKESFFDNLNREVGLNFAN